MSTPRVRPVVHFTPRQGWVNDPLGVTVRPDGVHLFYQHVPGDPTWDVGCHWGHAVSTDLVRWQERPVVLSPDDDDDGCWSGCVVPGAGLLLYTAVAGESPHLGRVRAARATDETWDTWRKGEVVVEPPEVPGLTVFRDPFVWWDDTRWRMLVGAAFQGGVAAVYTFTSVDLFGWEPDGVFAERSVHESAGDATGSLWECPQLVVVDGSEFLVVSVWDGGEPSHVACARGRTRGGRFHVEQWQRLSSGAGHYAATVFRDGEGTPGLVYWLRGVADPQGGWAGALSVPHRLSVSDGRLVAAPHPAVAATRLQPFLVDVELLGDSPGVRMPSWHCEVTVSRRSRAPATLEWLSSGATDPLLSVALGSGAAVVTAAGADPVRIEDGVDGPVTVLLDGCVAEVFLGAAGVVACALPVSEGRPPPSLRSTVADGSRVRASAWQLAP